MTAEVAIDEAKGLICEMCRLFYDQGWVSGTGGGISVKAGDNIVMAPSGVQKERMRPEDMFVLDAAGEVLHTPEARPPPYPAPKLSECSPLFMAAYELRGAGAVLHSHSVYAVLATLLEPDATEFKVTHLEMIKGIQGHGYFSNCIVPIIENTARECELTDRLRQAIHDYPLASAVLVRRHGVYIWGKTWIQAKTQAECYHYLFEAAVRMKGLGLDATRPPPPLLPVPLSNGKPHVEADNNGVASAEPAGKRAKLKHKLPAAIVLDIEGTVSSISYVADVMFPYARDHVKQHLESTYEAASTQEDIRQIREQAAADVAAGLSVSTIPDATAGKEAVISAVVRWVAAAIAADRKIGALKTLQGHIWESGFKSGALRGMLFRDVPDSLTDWARQGIKTYIYSSGSRLAQRLFFGYSEAGDLRPYLSGFFDTTSGSKLEAGSYVNIAEALGVDSPSDIVFATDNVLEAKAAAAAGWCAVLVDRPGNKPLPEDHGFRVIGSMPALLQ